MKKSNLLFTVLLFTVTASYAQTYIIPKAGANISIFAPADNKENVSSIVGFTGGVAVSIGLGNSFSIQPELLFIQKGGSYEFESTPGDGILEVRKTDVKINYLELPILAKYGIGNGVVKFYVNAGPSISIGLGGKTDYSMVATIADEVIYSDKAEGEVKFGDYPEESPAQDVYLKRRVDVGAQFGGGVLIADKVLVDFRYGLGLTKLDDEAQPKNRTFQFNVAVPFLIF
jgi:hypothetical protein